MTKKQLKETRRAEKKETEGRDVCAAADVRPVVTGSTPDRLADALGQILAGVHIESPDLPSQCDDDIPVETRLELMHCATQNGRISYWYLCDIWRRGRRSGAGAGITRTVALR